MEVTEENFPHLQSSTPKGKRSDGAQTPNSRPAAPKVEDEAVSQIFVTPNKGNVNKNDISFQVNADIHSHGCSIETKPGEDEKEEEWQLDRPSKRRRMKANRRKGSTGGSDIESAAGSRRTSVSSEVSEAWEVIDFLGQEEAPEPKKGPTKDREINDQLLKGFLSRKLATDGDEIEVLDDEDDIRNSEAQDKSTKIEVEVEKNEVDMTEDEMDEDYTDCEQDFSEPSIFDNITEHKFELDVTSFGSSNMRDVKMPGDQNLKINFNNYVAKSMPIREVHERLDDVREEKKGTLPVLVSHVGSCDFVYGQEPNIEGLLGEYVEFIEEAQYQCPNAIIIISSVLPRSGKGSVDAKAVEYLNGRILSFNNLLRKHCDKTTDVYFVDNYLFAVDPSWNPCKDLYWDDIHLNQVGKEKLSNSLFGVIATVYFGARLRKELLDTAP